MATPLARLHTYQQQDQHECGLVSSRLNAMLTSQSFFVTAGAILYTAARPTPIAPNGDELRTVLLPVAILGAFTAVMAGLAIGIGCYILRRWHHLGAALIANPDNRLPLALPAEAIDGCHLDRHRPSSVDWWHTLSLDLFAHSLPIAFLIFWCVVIRWLILLP